MASIVRRQKLPRNACQAAFGMCADRSVVRREMFPWQNHHPKEHCNTAEMRWWPPGPSTQSILSILPGEVEA